MLPTCVRRAVTTSGVCFLVLLLAGGCDRKARLLTVAGFGGRRPGGVAVSANGRLFVCFPRCSDESDLALAEVMPDGTVRPFPNRQVNRWRRGEDPKASFVCAQSVYADPAEPGGALWVLDAGNPGLQGVVPNAAKLVQIDLSADRIVRIISFDSGIAPPGSCLDDVRVDGRRGFAYVTDSGLGGLVVVDLNTNRSRRVLQGHRSTRAEEGVVPVIGGKPRRPDDGTVRQAHSNGIAISSDKESLYFKALAGRTLYRIDAAKLRNFSLPDSRIDAAVQSLGEAPVCDGMTMDREGNLYVTALEAGAILRRSPDGSLTTVVRDDAIRRPGSVAISPGGDLYFTDCPAPPAGTFNAAEDLPTSPCKLYKVRRATPPYRKEGRAAAPAPKIKATPIGL